jgi:hypothetical protein
MGCKTHQSGLDFRHGQEPFLRGAQTVLESNRVIYPERTESKKAPEREDDKSPSSITKVKNAWN